jgi:hypothetical protein
VRDSGTIVPWNAFWDNYIEWELEPGAGSTVQIRTDLTAVSEDSAADAARHDLYGLWPRIRCPVLLVQANRPMVRRVTDVVREAMACGLAHVDVDPDAALDRIVRSVPANAPASVIPGWQDQVFDTMYPALAKGPGALGANPLNAELLRLDESPKDEKAWPIVLTKCFGTALSARNPEWTRSRRHHLDRADQGHLPGTRQSIKPMDSNSPAHTCWTRRPLEPRTACWASFYTRPEPPFTLAEPIDLLAGVLTWTFATKINKLPRHARVLSKSPRRVLSIFAAKICKRRCCLTRRLSFPWATPARESVTDRGRPLVLLGHSLS